MGLDYRQLIDDVSDKDILLLNDGHIVLQVESIVKRKFFVRFFKAVFCQTRKELIDKGEGYPLLR